jgi:hypothetical protein
VWGNRGGIYPTLQRGEEPVLLVPDFGEGGGRVGIFGITQADQGSGFPIGVYLFGTFGAEANKHEQHHPELYQDKFKRQVTLIDTEEAEDSGDDQEEAVIEWTRGANPVSCKWVKQKGLAKGFDFDVSKVEQIFNLLLKEKQLKLPEGYKLPTA